VKPTAELTSTDVAGKKRHLGLRLVVLLLLLSVTLIAGCTWVAPHYAYSSGERAGYVQKISKKGLLCIMEVAGQRVALVYESTRESPVPALAKRSISSPVLGRSASSSPAAHRHTYT
jgi:hypothetical protein